MFQNLFIRNFDADDLLETFLLTAITSILAIRFYLELAGYPRIEPEGFHIAHMLFGGFFMLIAMMVLFNFLTKAAQQVAALIGGLGFGTFIDELGKFITSDNNYFFQPTVAIIYVIFILLYLSSKAIVRYKLYTQSEYFINALEIIKDSYINDLDKEEKEEALRYLKASDQSDPLVKSFIKTVKEMDHIDSPPPNFTTRIRMELRTLYREIVAKKWFIKVVIAFFILQTFLSVFYTVSLIVVPIILGIPITFSFSQMSEAVFSGISAILVLLGILRLYSSRYFAYQLFRYSILISIFLTQFFVFYREQFSALVGLAFNLIILGVLRYVLIREKSMQKIVTVPAKS